MTYLQQETSPHGGSPIELYEFVQGAETWRYTSAGADVVWGGFTWERAAISRTELQQNDEMAKNGITLTFPVDHEFARQFVGYGVESVTSVTLRRGHAADPDGEFVVYWKGRLAGMKVSGKQISLDCESVFTSMRRPGLRARYQVPCRHALYGRGCGLDQEDFAVEGIAAAVAGATVSVPEAALQPSGWYLGGMLRAADGVLRLVTGHAGAAVTLSRPIESLVQAVAGSGYGQNYGNYYGGIAVRLYPGCDHSAGAGGCTKFSNIDNYGGFLWIPQKNPMGGSSIV